MQKHRIRALKRMGFREDSRADRVSATWTGKDEGQWREVYRVTTLRRWKSDGRQLAMGEGRAICGEEMEKGCRSKQVQQGCKARFCKEGREEGKRSAKQPKHKKKKTGQVFEEHALKKTHEGQAG